MKVIVCLHGGPGTGKTTTSASLFAKFKQEDHSAEVNPEYIKGWVWEKRPIRPGDQNYFFAKQARCERILMDNELEVIITDSPLILTHYYGMKFDKYEQQYNTSLHMLRQHHGICKDLGYKTEHFWMNRVKKYQPKGRFQTEEEAKQCDVEIKALLDKLYIKYTDCDADINAAEILYGRIIEKYGDM